MIYIFWLIHWFFFFMFQVSNLQHEVVVYNALSWINFADE